MDRTVSLKRQVGLFQGQNAFEIRACFFLALKVVA